LKPEVKLWITVRYWWLVRWCGCSHTTEPTTTLYFNWLF